MSSVLIDSLSQRQSEDRSQDAYSDHLELAPPRRLEEVDRTHINEVFDTSTVEEPHSRTNNKHHLVSSDVEIKKIKEAMLREDSEEAKKGEAASKKDAAAKPPLEARARKSIGHYSIGKSCRSHMPQRSQSARALSGR